MRWRLPDASSREEAAHEMASCVFCRIASGELPSHRIDEDDLTMAFLDIGHVNPGHVLVAAKQHVESVFDLSPEQAAAVFQMAQRVAQAVERQFTPEGLTILQANGEAGGQTVFHFHLHVLPRHTGDAVSIVLPPTHPPAEQLSEYAARLRME